MSALYLFVRERRSGASESVPCVCARERGRVRSICVREGAHSVCASVLCCLFIDFPACLSVLMALDWLYCLSLPCILILLAHSQCVSFCATSPIFSLLPLSYFVPLHVCLRRFSACSLPCRFVALSLTHSHSPRLALRRNVSADIDTPHSTGHQQTQTPQLSQSAAAATLSSCERAGRLQDRATAPVCVVWCGCMREWE